MFDNKGGLHIAQNSPACFLTGVKYIRVENKTSETLRFHIEYGYPGIIFWINILSPTENLDDFAICWSSALTWFFGTRGPFSDARGTCTKMSVCDKINIDLDTYL